MLRGELLLLCHGIGGQPEAENLLPMAAQRYLGGEVGIIEADRPLGVAGDILGVRLLRGGTQGVPYRHIAKSVFLFSKYP